MSSNSLDPHPSRRTEVHRKQGGEGRAPQGEAIVPGRMVNRVTWQADGRKEQRMEVETGLTKVAGRMENRSHLSARKGALDCRSTAAVFWLDMKIASVAQKWKNCLTLYFIHLKSTVVIL